VRARGAANRACDSHAEYPAQRGTSVRRKLAPCLLGTVGHTLAWERTNISTDVGTAANATLGGRRAAQQLSEETRQLGNTKVDRLAHQRHYHERVHQSPGFTISAYLVRFLALSLCQTSTVGSAGPALPNTDRHTRDNGSDRRTGPHLAKRRCLIRHL
jgi:hypothetical protein